MSSKKKPKRNIRSISGLLNQKMTIPVIDASHEDVHSITELINAARSEY